MQLETILRHVRLGVHKLSQAKSFRIIRVLGFGLFIPFLASCERGRESKHDSRPSLRDPLAQDWGRIEKGSCEIVAGEYLKLAEVFEIENDEYSGGIVLRWDDGELSMDFRENFQEIRMFEGRSLSEIVKDL